MTLRHQAKVVFTASLAMELAMPSQVTMIRQALAALKGRVDFVIFDPNATERSIEDEGRTARLTGRGLEEKCYAEISDYGEDDGKVLTIYKASER